MRLQPYDDKKRSIGELSKRSKLQYQKRKLLNLAKVWRKKSDLCAEEDRPEKGKKLSLGLKRTKRSVAAVKREGATVKEQEPTSFHEGWRKAWLPRPGSEKKKSTRTRKRKKRAGRNPYMFSLRAEGSKPNTALLKNATWLSRKVTRCRQKKALHRKEGKGITDSMQKMEDPINSALILGEKKDRRRVGHQGLLSKQTGGEGGQLVNK